MSAAVPWIGVLLRDPLGFEAEAAVGRVEVRQEAPPPEERRTASPSPRGLDGLLHEARGRPA